MIVIDFPFCQNHWFWLQSVGQLQMNVPLERNFCWTLSILNDDKLELFSNQSNETEKTPPPLSQSIRVGSLATSFSRLCINSSCTFFSESFNFEWLQLFSNQRNETEKTLPPLSQSVGDRWCEQRGGRWLISAAESRSWTQSSRLTAEQILDSEAEQPADCWADLRTDFGLLDRSLLQRVGDVVSAQLLNRWPAKRQFWKSLLLNCRSIGDQQRFRSWGFGGVSLAELRPITGEQNFCVLIN